MENAKAHEPYITLNIKCLLGLKEQGDKKMSKNKDIERVALTIRIPETIMMELEAQYGHFLHTRNSMIGLVLHNWFQQVIEARAAHLPKGGE